MTEKELTDCYWFLQGQCNKGKNCEYRHNEAVLQNQQNCKFWMEGSCKNVNCAYRHPSGVKTATTSNKTPCIFYIQGKCTKGDSCPFSHTTEEGIKKLQEERQKEEERLLKLKEEADKLQREIKEKKIQREAPSAAAFVKTLNSIKNEKSQKPQKPERKQQNNKIKNDNNNTGVKNAPKKQNKQQNATSGQKGFGVKSLDEIIKTKDSGEKKESVEPTKVNPSIGNKDGLDVGELRKKNLQKFGQSPVNTTTKEKSAVPSNNNSTSPKKRQTNESPSEGQTENDIKRRKTEETAKVEKPQTPTSKPKVEEDDFDKELAELAGDVNTDEHGDMDEDELLNV